MPGHDIIVIGASAGGVEALQTIVHELPLDLPAAVFVVLHMSPYGRSMMPQILTRSGNLPATHAKDDEGIRTGRIYVAPPDRHLIIRNGRIRVTNGPQENRVRPAVDALFRTAAASFRNRVIGVVLTGNLDDGTAGLIAIKRLGGITVAQDPEDSLYPGMPASAIENARPDHVLPLAQIAPMLVKLVHEPVEEIMAAGPDDEMEQEVRLAAMEPGEMHDPDRPGDPSVFACPDCHGTLFEIHEGEMARFRCRVGHAYSPESLLAAQADGVEEALWTALRALEEKLVLTRRIVQRMRERGHGNSIKLFERQAQEAHDHAEVLRRVLVRSAETFPDDAVIGEGGNGGRAASRAETTERSR